MYKDVAKSTWAEIGVSDPTVETSGLALVSASIPDKKVETSESAKILQIKMNANNMASVLYLVGSLYENSNFALTNGVAKFSASAVMGGSTHEYNFSIKPQLDITNNKVYLEAYIVMDNSMPQYIVVDANYNFESETLSSFRIYTLSGGMYLDIELTEDNKNKFYGTMDLTDTFAVAVNSEMNSFIAEIESVEELTFDFTLQVQNYMTLLQKVITELMG